MNNLQSFGLMLSKVNFAGNLELSTLQLCFGNGGQLLNSKISDMRSRTNDTLLTRPFYSNPVNDAWIT